MKTLSLALLALLFASCSAETKIGYKKVGQFNHPSPAFVRVAKFPNQKDHLLISQFTVFGKGSVSVIPNIGDYLTAGSYDNVKSTTLSDAFTWPNNVDVVPPQVFGPSVNAITVPDGFLVPFHNKGEVYIIATDPQDLTKSQALYQLTQPKSGFFYHVGQWLDMNGDGRLDYVTARTNAGANQGQLLWLEHPAEGLQKTPWTEHVVASPGPEVQFEIHEFPHDYPNSYIVFSAEFFSHKLQVYEISKNGGQVLNSKLIDSTLDQVYSVQYVDMDNDGKFELLVNNHESNNAKAGVYLFNAPQPKDFFTGDYPRTTIASGFKNAFSFSMNNMCPGFPYAVWPQTHVKQSEQGRAYVLIAGDGDYSAHLLTPVTNQNGEEEYQRSLIENLGGTVGSITYGDSNNNGWLEFYVPNYDKSYVEVFEFYDASSQKQAEEQYRFLTQ